VTDLRELRGLAPQFSRAPSAHNTQPWILEYRADRVDLRFDPARALPVGDPTRRDLYLSLGAFVEAVLVTATSGGIAIDFVTADDEERVGSFVPVPEAYAARFTPNDLARRQTSRLDYEPRRLGESDLAACRKVLAENGALYEVAAPDLADLYVRADRHLYDSPAVVAELRDWLRLTPRDPRYGQDGLSRDCLALGRVEAALLGHLLRPRVYPVVRMLRVHRTFTSATRSLLAVDHSVLVLTAPAGPPGTLLAHGRALLRVWLELARREYYTHPLSQIVDCPETERELGDRLGLAAGVRALSVFRAGRSERPSRSARLTD
jgi:hypothetical protein